MSYRRRIITVLTLTAAGVLTTGCGENNVAPGQGTQDGNPSVASSVDGAGGEEVTVTRGKEHHITESDSTHTVRCDGGGDIDVRADNVTLTMSGGCEELEIQGSQNTVTSENLQEIDLEGNSNSLTASDVRELSLEGNANSATLSSVSEIDVEGPDNTVTYETGDPKLEDEGTNTTINAA